jgi:hypothetical protein
MGAPGYTPAPPLPPHAPMPGAPPYPAAPAAERSATPIGRPATAHTGVPTVAAAAAVWAAVNVLLVIVGPGVGNGARLGLGMLISTVLATIIGWSVVRRRACSFWWLLALVAPIYWVLRAVFSAFVG